MHISGEEALRDQIARATDAPRTYSLPPACYADPGFFELEIERIFRREWISLAHVSQLAEPGDYICRDLFGEPLVITRDLTGNIHVLSRVCLHRWTEIVSGSGNAKAFVCPFHSWSYDLDGQLLGAPITKEESGFETHHCRLAEFHHEVCDGFVFVNLDGEAPPLTFRAKPLSERFEKYHLAEMTVAFSLSYDCSYNWKILVETFMESYHHIGVHRKTLERHFPGRLSEPELGNEAFGLLHTNAKEPEMSVFFPPIPGLPSEHRDRFITVNLYPFHLLAFFPDLVAWFRVVPKAADRCELETLILLPPETMSHSDITDLIEDSRQIWDQINREDMEVNVSQQRGLFSRRAKAGRLNRLEGCNIEFANYTTKMVT